MQIWRVKEQGIQVFKLIYLSNEEFKFLRHLRLCFLKSAGKFFKKHPNVAPVAQKQALQCPINNDLKPSRGNHRIISYESTSIHNAYDSLFWSWRRFKEYYRYLLHMDDDNNIKQAYTLMYS
jgi:hypothetical protein